MSYIKFKNLIDFIFAILAIIIFSPLIFFISFLIKLKLGSPIFFIQKRPGLKEKVFYLIKFRTMHNKKDQFGNPLADDMRLPVFGKWLRETSIDEIPTLFNVLKGEMSFIGPRPLLMEYIPLYNEEEKKRHNVKPGITGLAQINGRNLISWKKKFNYDIYYADNLSFCLDLKIFFITILKVLKKEGINSKYNKPVKPFKGNNN